MGHPISIEELDLPIPVAKGIQVPEPDVQAPKNSTVIMNQEEELELQKLQK